MSSLSLTFSAPWASVFFFAEARACGLGFQVEVKEDTEEGGAADGTLIAVGGGGGGLVVKKGGNNGESGPGRAERQGAARERFD